MKIDFRIATVVSLLWFALCLILAVLERNQWKIDQWLFLSWSGVVVIWIAAIGWRWINNARK